MEDSVEHFEDLFGQFPLRDGDQEVFPGSVRLQFLLDFIQKLTQELLRILLVVSAERWNQVPHGMQHGERRHQRPPTRPHDPEERVQLVTQ